MSRPNSDQEAPLLKPGEVCRKTGVSRQSLYQYRTLGLIKPKVTTRTGRHLYADNAVQRLDIIMRLVKRGYPLQEIRQIFFKDGR